MTAKSKQKGNRHQREVAKKFQNWWGGEWVSTPNSGGLRWNNKIWAFGDLTPPEDFKATIECKHYKDVNLMLLLTGKVAHKDSILGHWQQSLNDAERASNTLQTRIEPFLVVRQNYVPDIFACTWDFARDMELDMDLWVNRDDLGLERFSLMPLERLFDQWTLHKLANLWELV